MAQYKKSQGVGGEWAKAESLQNGLKAKLVSETVPMESQYGTQDVAKIRFQGHENSLNVRLNKPTVNGLVDAFGEESKDWIGKVLTVQTEKMVVSGRRVTVLYLIPEGYELTEDEGGYLVIKKMGTKEADAEVVPVDDGGPELTEADVPW